MVTSKNRAANWQLSVVGLQPLLLCCSCKTESPMPNGFATYTRLSTVMQSETNAKVSPVLTSSMRHPNKWRNSLIFSMRHSMVQKSDEVGKKRKH